VLHVEMEINGTPVRVSLEHDEFLADTLRRYGYLSVKQGCETGNCGLCSVWLDGKPTLSCSTLSIRAAGRKITTLEGVQEQARERGTSLAMEHPVAVYFQ